MKRLLVVLFCIAASACTTVERSTRVSSPIQSREFNSVASKYLDRPTQVAIENMSDGVEVLSISMSRYGGSTSTLRFSRNSINSYVPFVEKYIEWESIAKSRADALTKEIGRAPTWSNMSSGDLKYIFHSGNQSSHFLAISFCAAGTCLDDQAQYFDQANAAELLALFRNLASGKLQRTDVNAIYK